MMKNHRPNGLALVKWSKSKPAKPIIGPGKTGSSEPRIATTIQIVPSKMRTMSMENFKFKIFNPPVVF
jgi:hypothetical protein